MLNIQSFLLADPNLPFLVTASVVLGLVVLELILLVVGQSIMLADGGLDLHLDLNGNGIPDSLEGHAGLGGFLNPGHIPLTVFVLVFCGLFSLLGYSAQWAWVKATASYAPMMLSVPLTLLPTLALTRWASVGVARAIPQLETNAVTLESLSGSLGVVTAGPISGVQDQGIARFTDHHGVDHSVLAMLDQDVTVLTGEAVIMHAPHPTNLVAFIVRKPS